MGLNTKNIAIIPPSKDRKVNTIISGGNIQISGRTNTQQIKYFNFEVVTSDKIKKERNSAYQYFTID